MGFGGVRGRWQSIERRLPLLISGVLVVAIALFAWAAYNRVQRALLAGASERLRSAASVTGVLLGQAMSSYRSQVIQVATDTSVAAFLTDGRGRSKIRQVLARGWNTEPIPRGRIVLLRPDGSVAADTARGVVPATTAWPEHVIASRSLAPGQAVIGPLHQFGDSAFTETVAAIPAPGEARGEDDGVGGSHPRIIGYLADVRFVASGGAHSIRDLIGGNARMLIGSPDQGVWSDLEHVRPAPPRVEPGLSVVFWQSANGPGVGAAATITNTPWVLWVAQPMRTVLAPTHALVMQLVLVAAVLIVAGVIGAWILSRRLTMPIVALTAAAERVAQAPGMSAEGAESYDEIIRLTEAFDRMAARVADSLALAEAARAEAEASNHAKGAFLATISHELRTPLNAITGYAALLQEEVRGPINPEQAEDISRIRKAGNHLLGLINDLLNFAKLEAGEVRVDVTDVPIDGVLREAAAMVEPQVRAKGLSLRYQPSPTALVVRGDREKILQIVLNLLGNSIKFTASGGQVALATQTEGDTVAIIVRDTGRGISAEQLHRVFEPFVQVGRQLASTGEGGVGLGLAISRELARALSGDLTAESAVGKGSAFTLTLPKAQGAAAVAIGPSGAPSPTVPPTSTPVT